MSSTLSQIREGLAASLANARRAADARRAGIARRLALSHSVTQVEILEVAPTPEAVDALETEVSRWRKTFDAWAVAQNLPAIEGELRTSEAAAAARRAAIEAEIAPLKRLQSRSFEQNQRLQSLGHELFRAVRDPAAVARLRAAQAAYQVILGLMPERRAADEAHQRALGLASARLARAESALGGLIARPLAKRLRERLAEMGEAIRWRPGALDGPLARAEVADLQARLARAPEEDAATEREARAEVAAARDALNELNAVPEMFELISAELAAYEAEAGQGQGQGEAPRGPRRKRAEAPAS